MVVAPMQLLLVLIPMPMAQEASRLVPMSLLIRWARSLSVRTPLPMERRGLQLLVGEHSQPLWLLPQLVVNL